MIIKGTTHGEYTNKFPDYTFNAPVMIDFIEESKQTLQNQRLAEELLIAYHPAPGIENKSVKLMNYEVRFNKGVAEFWTMPNEWTIAKEPRKWCTMDSDPQIPNETIEYELLKFIIGRPEDA